VGFRTVKDVGYYFGKQNNLSQLIINGAPRTTGAAPGKIVQIFLTIKS
jgi:hypothetical protein